MKTQVRRQSRRVAGWIRRCVVVGDVGVVGGSYGEPLVTGLSFKFDWLTTETSDMSSER